LHQNIDERFARARCSLEGLSVGDALGDQFFIEPEEVQRRIEERLLPPSPWLFSDDTQMALSIVSILRQHGTIAQDQLAASFAERYEPSRGYGPSMHHQLRSVRDGKPWKEAATGQFGGQGSFGNGSAMRIAPLGAFFADSIQQVVEQATYSAEVTHAHPEAIAGAIAVAVAAALAWQLRGTKPGRSDFLDLVIPHVPESTVHSRLLQARNLSNRTSVEAAATLGSGYQISAQDTVPFALWCAGQYLHDYEEAIWQTIRGLGDIDTTCAMVGGIVALYTGVEGIPAEWREARESLPHWPFADAYRPPAS
jgi:ADP-ribosylglycohydrolase